LAKICGKVSVLYLPSVLIKILLKEHTALESILIKYELVLCFIYCDPKPNL